MLSDIIDIRRTEILYIQKKKKKKLGSKFCFGGDL